MAHTHRGWYRNIFEHYFLAKIGDILYIRYVIYAEMYVLHVCTTQCLLPRLEQSLTMR